MNSRRGRWNRVQSGYPPTCTRRRSALPRFQPVTRSTPLEIVDGLGRRVDAAMLRGVLRMQSEAEFWGYVLTIADNLAIKRLAASGRSSSCRPESRPEEHLRELLHSLKSDGDRESAQATQRSPRPRIRVKRPCGSVGRRSASTCVHDRRASLDGRRDRQGARRGDRAAGCRSHRVNGVTKAKAAEVRQWSAHFVTIRDSVTS